MEEEEDVDSREGSSSLEVVVIPLGCDSVAMALCKRSREMDANIAASCRTCFFRGEEHAGLFTPQSLLVLLGFVGPNGGG